VTLRATQGQKSEQIAAGPGAAFDLPDEDQAALWRLVALVRRKLVSELQPVIIKNGERVGSRPGR
jgi:hypothetical protein